MATTRRTKRGRQPAADPIAAQPPVADALPAEIDLAEPEASATAAPAPAEAAAMVDLSANEAPTLTLPTLSVHAPAEESPAAPPALDTSSPQPAPAPAITAATQPALSPAAELAAFQRRRMWGALGLLALLMATGLVAFQLFGRGSAQQPATTPPQAGAPAAAPPALAGAPAAGDVAIGECSPIAGLPVFAGASCIKQERDEDDGQIKIENRYAAPATPDAVRQFYESAFTQGGWAIDDTEHDVDDQQWQYTVEQGDRKLKVTIEPHEDAAGATELRIAEK